VISLYLSVPVACFRASYARIYVETLPVPAPSTIYGMLLSLVGETDREKHTRVRLAFGMISEPEISTVLRKMWRVKSKNLMPGQGANATPDFQQLLTGIEMLLWIDSSHEPSTSSLEDRVNSAIRNPTGIKRFGSLCLGESTHILNDIRFRRLEDERRIRMLVPFEEGDLSLPLWADHVNSSKTIWGQFQFSPFEEFRQPNLSEFIAIAHPVES